jgi:hypothetical protein
VPQRDSCGYAACFGGALDYVATQKKRNAKGAAITRSVTIGARDARGASHATRGNAPVELVIEGARRAPAAIGIRFDLTHQKRCCITVSTYFDQCACGDSR